MAEKRKYNNVNLRTGESYRSDGRFVYRYTLNGKEKSVYAKTLKELREKEHTIQKDNEDGIDTTKANKITLNDMFEKYISSKTRLKETTIMNYKFCYDKYVRNDIGNKKVAKIVYSDIKNLYNNLLEDKIQYGSLKLVNNILHPIFDMAVKDDIIRKNPTDNILKDIRGTHDTKPIKRLPMSNQEQSAFMEYARNSNVYKFYVPMFTVFLGTGARLGELIGLTWDDVDFENGIININHTLNYKKTSNGKIEFTISPTKTNAGTREIPMFSEVRTALLNEKKRQFQNGGCKSSISGEYFNIQKGNVEKKEFNNFVFTNSRNHVHKPATLNRVMDNIIKQHNKDEIKTAEKENREAFQIRHFSVHNLRHTFCTNYCQLENNLKTIQEIMGHSDIGVTMNIYAEATENAKRKSFENIDGKIKIG